MREKFEANLKELERSYAKKLTELTDALELQRKVEIHEMEERKNLHINDLMKNHKKAFTQIKDYYNEITTGNLKLIKELKVHSYHYTLPQNAFYNFKTSFFLHQK